MDENQEKNIKTSDISDIFILGHCLINDKYHYKVVGLPNHSDDEWILAREIPSHSYVAAYWRQFSFERQLSASANIDDVIKENAEESKSPEKDVFWPEEEEIEILGILKNQTPLKYVIRFPQKTEISIVPSSYIKKKYPVSMSKFLEHNIEFF